MSDRQFYICVGLYVLMSFFTNAYCQTHRWNDWLVTTNKGLISAGPAENKLIAATILWPAYWTARGCLYIVEHPPKICWETEKE